VRAFTGLSNGVAHETEEKPTLSHEYSAVENSQPIGLRGSSLESRDVETNSSRNPGTQSSPGGGWPDLRAAAGLIPIIEAGLIDSKLSVERAALMASFCEWTTEKRSADPEAIKLAGSVDEGLKRIKMALAAAV